jgi:hypothetical protein
MVLSTSRLEQKPYALFCPVNPVFEETRGCYIHLLIADVLELSHVTVFSDPFLLDSSMDVPPVRVPRRTADAVRRGGVSTVFIESAFLG